jgi:hypothetical protein
VFGAPTEGLDREESPTVTTIIATAPVPGHLELSQADTAEIRSERGRLRSRADVHALARSLPPDTPARRAARAAFAARIVDLPLAEQAARYGVSLDQAAAVRALFAGSLR